MSITDAKPPEAARPAARAIVFSADGVGGPDALGLEGDIAVLAELAAHPGAQTPLTIAVLGGPGSGKSFALHALAQRIGARTARGGLARIIRATIDAPAGADAPADAIAAAIHTGLAEAALADPAYAAFAEEAAHLGRDAQAVARDASERLGAAQAALSAERSAKDDLDARQARLPETILYQAAGSRIDTYARANRARLDATLRRLGLIGADPVMSYKDIVRDISQGGGPLPRVSASLRALWAFRGQTRLIVTAVLLALIGAGLFAIQANSGYWLPKIAALGDNATGAAAWLNANLQWFGVAGWAALGLAALALVLNLSRATRLMQPVLKGLSLLRGDVGQRRREIESQQAHGLRRMEGARAAADAAARQADAAEQRLGKGGRSGAPAAMPFAPAASAEARWAQDYVRALAALMDRAAAPPPITLTAQAPAMAVPQRIILFIDHVDALAPAAAADFIETAHRLLQAPGFLTVFAADAARLPLQGRERAAWLEKHVQLPLNLAGAAAPVQLSRLAVMTAGFALPANPAPVKAAAALDAPVTAEEMQLLDALLPLAGATPRAAKQFINLYTLARTRDDGPRPALALMLALEQGGTPQEHAAVTRVMDGAAGGPFPVPGEAPHLGPFFVAAEAALGRALTIGEARAARETARRFSARAV